MIQISSECWIAPDSIMAVKANDKRDGVIIHLKDSTTYTIWKDPKFTIEEQIASIVKEIHNGL